MIFLDGAKGRCASELYDEWQNWLQYWVQGKRTRGWVAGVRALYRTLDTHTSSASTNGSPYLLGPSYLKCCRVNVLGSSHTFWWLAIRGWSVLSLGLLHLPPKCILESAALKKGVVFFVCLFCFIFKKSLYLKYFLYSLLLVESV